MKIAHLVQTHANPNLLKRKIEFLSSEDYAFFIHVDRKSDINNFSEVRGDNVFFCERRIPVHWGEYSVVEAILVLIRKALEGTQKYDYFVLSLGSDFPLKSKTYIRDFFDKNSGREFIGTIKLPGGESCRVNSGMDGCAAYAAQVYYSHLDAYRIPSTKPNYRIILKIMSRLGMVRRSFKKYFGEAFEPFAGNASWALTRDACLYIVDFVENNRKFCKYFENVFAPDEKFFHTILGNSNFRTRISRHLTFEDWSVPTPHPRTGPAGYQFFERLSHKGGHPAWLSAGHIVDFESRDKVMMDDIYGSSEMLFARKFRDADINLVQRIEAMINLTETP